MQYRADIQIMRAIAVFVVVLFHLDFTFFKNGFLGVDIFFVISGFLMAVLYKKGQVKHFYERRARRLLPAYFATIFFTLIVSAFFVLSIDHQQVVEQSVWGTFFASNIGFWNQASYFSSKYFNPLLHLWSLGVEIQFYILVPLLFFLFYRSAKVVGLIALFSLVFAMIALVINSKTPFFITPFRIWQFLAGGGVALYFTNRGAVKSYKPCYGFIALLGLLALVFFYPIKPESGNIALGHPGVVTILVTFFTSVILAFGLPRFFVNNIAGKGIVKVGDWSYSIYLAHFPVIVFYLYQPLSGTNLKPNTVVDIVFLIGLITTFSAILYLLFDRRRWSVTVKSVFISIAGILILAFVSSYLVSYKNSSFENNILKSYDDRDQFRCGRFYRMMDELNISKYFACEITSGLSNDAESVFLLGDSTADAIKASLAKEAKQHGFHLYTAASNRAASGYLSTQKIIDELHNLGIKKIIAHFYSPFMRDVLDREMYESLVEAGFQVVWIAPVPYFSEPVPKISYEMRNETSLTYPSQNFEQVMKITDTLRSKGIYVFEPWPLLCEKGNCDISNVEGNAYYHDQLHMSLTGAKQLEPLFADVFQFFSLDKIIE